MKIQLTQESHQKLCEVFGVEHRYIKFEPIKYEGCEHRKPWNKGIPRTEEEKKAISKKQMVKIPWNKGKPCCEETRLKLAGRKRTTETIEKIKQNRSTQIRFPHTEETKKKMTESRRLYWENKRKVNTL